MSQNHRQRRSTPAGSPPPFRLILISLLAAVIGAMAGVTAEILDHLIGLVTNLAFYGRISTEMVSPAGHQLGAFVILVPAIGGLIIGLLARYGSDLVRGHGIPEAMEAVLLRRSRIPPKLALLKPISAAISIGSGQPFGAEGPIIQTGAALGSILGQSLRMTSAERKVLLACGAAAGIAAIFNTPIAAVIFVIELLLFEFKTRSFVPLVIATTIAAEFHLGLFGTHPVFSATAISFGGPLNLVFFLLLGIVAGLASLLLTRLLYWIEDAYHRLPINTYLWPALGGLLVGIIGYLVPLVFGDTRLSIFGPGYDLIDGILNGHYALAFLIVLLLAKAAVWLIALGSGTSGGVLAPVFMIGAAVGGIFGLVVKAIFPAMDVAPEAFAIVGMVAVFGSATRATFAAILFAFETTQNYQVILPVMFACSVADMLVVRLSKYSILTEQLRRKGVHVHHEYQADALCMISVESVMIKDVVTVPATMMVATLIERINQHDARLTRHQALVIVDEAGKLAGIITRGDLVKALNQGGTELTVAEAGITDVIVGFPDETVREALTRMIQHDIGRMPVVSPDDPSQLVGYLSRVSVMAAHTHSIQEEHEFEPGWVL